MRDSTTLFSDRVESYVQYRPHYPASLIALLRERLGLEAGWTVADIGSGTGISSERFIEAGCSVYGVEPNAEMRAAAEAAYAGEKGFRSVGARAEVTGIADLSVDLYVAGQAFHWFDRAAARMEALRILRLPKRALLMWNDWSAGNSPFLADYAAFLDARMPQRMQSDFRNLGEAEFAEFFGSGHWERAILLNAQSVSFAVLAGRLSSASYAPKAGDLGYEDTMRDLKAVFDRHASGGILDFPYSTILYFGTLVD